MVLAAYAVPVYANNANKVQKPYISVSYYVIDL